MSPNGFATGGMNRAAENVLGVLGDDQRAAICFPFGDPDRCAWHYTPGIRKGVSLASMDRGAAKAVHQMLATILSRAAHTRIAAIAGLEDVLDESEGGRRDRHAGDYWTAFFGTPGDRAWGWRFEGHHVSINVTAVNGSICTTPFFLGASPAVVADECGRTVSRPLAPEEDVGARLLSSLDDDQRKRAVVSDAAPPDIMSGETADPSDVVGLGAHTGLPVTALRPDQVSLLRSLAAVYVCRVSDGLAEPILADVDHHLRGFCFAWAGSGSVSAGQPRYYRLEGRRFLAEFDNRQNSANHIHSVWREPYGDFGARLLQGGEGRIS